MVEWGVEGPRVVDYWVVFVRGKVKLVRGKRVYVLMEKVLFCFTSRQGSSVRRWEGIGWFNRHLSEFSCCRFEVVAAGK